MKNKIQEKQRGLEIWQDQPDCLQSPLLPALDPLRAPALCCGGLNAPEVAFVDWLRQLERVVNLQTQKSPLATGSFVFGRTSQIRTGDLYHVKASVTRRYTDSSYFRYSLTTKLSAR